MADPWTINPAEPGYSRHAMGVTQRRVRVGVARKAGETRTADNGKLKLRDSWWEVLAGGDRHDADLVLNALRRPN